MVMLIFSTNIFVLPNISVKADSTYDNQLDVSFKGSFEEDTYVSTEEETVSNKLIRRSGDEAIDEELGVILNGNKDGIDFESDFTLGEGKTVDTPIILEAKFTPNSNQKDHGTVLSVGGNMYVRYQHGKTDTLEYGFEVNNNGSWSSAKQSVSAPKADEEQTIALVYQPTEEGATLRVFLNNEELPMVVSEDGKAALAETDFTIGFGNDVHSAGQERGFIGSISQVVAASFSGDFESNMLKISKLDEKDIEDPETPVESQSILDVRFGGAFSSDAGYTNPTGEIMDGKLTQKTGNENISKGVVPLKGNKEGINFQPRESLISDGAVTKPFIIEVEFTPDANQSFQNTLLAFGGNMYARYTSSSVFEYGFEVNNNGSWSSKKQVIDAPRAGDTHNLAIVYIPTSKGAEMHAFLNGEALPVVTSNIPSALANDLENEIAFGNEVHPAGLTRGFNGSLSAAIVTTFEGTFHTSLLKTMEITNIDRKLKSYWQGELVDGSYTGTDDEIVDGNLRITNGELSGIGTVTLHGEDATITFNPTQDSDENVFENGFISEILIEPELLNHQATLFELDNAIKLQSNGDGKTLELYVDNKASERYDLSNSMDEDSLHLSMVYVNNENEHSLMLLEGSDKIGQASELSSSFKVDTEELTLLRINEQAEENVHGVAFSAIEGVFNTTHLMLTSGACFVPKDLEPGHQIEIKQGECAAAIAAKASLVRPKPKQVSWQQYEQTAFIHYGINTYYGVEWGDLWNHNDPKVFNPTDLDTDQWARTLKDSGFKMAVLTVKHHDGFTLYPSRYTDFSVANSSWKNGEGDVLREFTESMRKHGIKVGIYLSPADHSAYRDEIFANGSERSTRSIPTLVEGDDRIGKNLPTFDLQATDYGEMFLNQLYEVLTEYGEVDEVWFDGAQGNIPGNKEEKYDWDSYYELIEELAPNAVVAVTGHDVRWVGNESGWARDNEWSVLAAKLMDDGRQAFYPSSQSSDLGSRKMLTEAASNGMDYLTWWPSEVDVSIRPGWFYHDSQQPKSLDHLRNIYYDSVARNSVLLLNIPPNKEGKFAEQDVERLKDWHDSIRRDVGINHTKNAQVTAHNGASDADPNAVIDNDYDTSWYTNSTADSSLTFTFNKSVDVKRIVLQENINHGQQVESFAIDVKNSNGDWEEIYKNQSIGYKRIVTLDKVVKGEEFRLRILQARGPVHLSEVGFYQTLPEDAPLLPDLSKLEELIDEAKDISNEDQVYTEESYEALQLAITSSEESLDTIETEEELSAAIDSLQNAIDGLEINVAKLESLLKEAKEISNKDETYTKESFESLQQAIKEAEESLDSIDTTEKLSTAIDSLQSAIDGLEEKEDLQLDISELEALIEEAKEISNEDETYTEESYESLQQAIKEAEESLDSIDTTEKLSTAIESLQSAIDGLEEKEDPQLDISELEALIEEAKEISNEDETYTEESYESLQQAIKEAEESLDSIDTADKLSAAIDSLQSAMDSLKINVNELKALIEVATEITNEDYRYTDESFEALQESIEEAKQSLDSVETSEGLTEAIDRLQTAIEGLEEREVNTNDLEALISTAKEISNDDGTYTDESFQVLQRAIESAEEALATNVTGPELFAAFAALKNALDSLEKVDQIDVSELEALIKEAKEILNEDEMYTKDSFDELLDAIKLAEASLESIETEEHLAEALKVLQSAIDGLEVNKSVLEELIAQAKEISNEDKTYTEKSFKALQDAIKEADKSLEAIETTEDLSKAIEALQLALDGLEESNDSDKIDVSELEKLITKAKEISNDNKTYTEKSFKALQDAIKEADKSLEAIETTEDLSKAIEALQLALDGLEESNVSDEIDVSELEKLITKAKEISNDNKTYTEESFKALQDAIKEADKSLEAIETTVDLSKAIEALQLALDGLEESNDSNKIDVSELEKLIKKAKEISNDNKTYTEKSFKALQQAIKAAEESLKSIETDKELTEVISSLQLAIDELQKTEDPVGEDPENKDPVQGSPKDPSKGTSEQFKEQGKTQTTSTGTQSGKKLPKTATYMYTWMAIGLLLIISGVFYFIFRRKGKKDLS